MESEEEDVFKNNGVFVSVFSPRVICGEKVEPFCEPMGVSQQANMIAAATNLVWWTMHESLADGKVKDAFKYGDMLLDILRHEVSKEEWAQAKDLILSIIQEYNETDSSSSTSLD